MALIKTKITDKIEILRDGVVQVREAIEVFDDLELMGQKYHRYTCIPSQPLNTIPDLRVRAICNLIWTPAVIAAYIAALPSKPA